MAAIVEFLGTVGNGDIHVFIGAMPGIFAECEVNSVVKNEKTERSLLSTVVKSLFVRNGLKF